MTTAQHESVNPNAYVINFDDFEGPNEFAFLSNFYRTPCVIGGVAFPTSEHAYAAAKAADANVAANIAWADGPGKAKGLGRMATLRPEWEAIKFDVMKACLRAKFVRHSEMAERLLETNYAVLIEGTYWRDTVWGVDLIKPGTPGHNWLGTLLMARRAELQLSPRDIKGSAERRRIFDICDRIEVVYWPHLKTIWELPRAGTPGR